MQYLKLSEIEPLINGGEIYSTIMDALKKTSPKEIIVICGSFTLMREARQALGFRDDCDPAELNEPSHNYSDI